ncbi:MAG: PhzF family phenazine biosynthesis protein [Pseudomonadota bacterium]|nr:PhzF family phenazine biosynthesis protein [Pseudomonadota bacterium]MEE3070105.1 PhzF family phenazine biosynthesis protein [Pseudomonadota bacterium]
MANDFKIVDVFSATPFQGNPVAVVMNADGLTDQQMQRIAAWTNLSETTFHLTSTSPDADYRLRIFTPRSELPFAGHPTLGSAHALIEAGLVDASQAHVVQECGAGLVPVSVSGEGATRVLRLQLPQPKIRDLTQAEQKRLTDILGAPLLAGSQAALVDVGARWIVAELNDAATVLSLTPDMNASAQLEAELAVTGVSVFGGNSKGGIEVRSFAPSCGVNEDPVCGSGNGSIAAYRLMRGQIAEGAEYTATQGKCVGRAGHIYISIHDSRIFVGGQAVTTVSGQINAN